MEVKQALYARRSVRQFLDKEVSDELIRELLEAAFSGPSAMNRRPWEFYVVKNADKVAELRRATRYSNINGKIAIIVCGNLENAIPGEGTPYWIQDCSGATENMLLRATDLGLGSLWCGIYPSLERVEAVRKVIGAPEHHVPLNILYFGYAATESSPRIQWEDGKVHILD